MAKQVAHAHENATRQTVCPWERGRGGMAWHGKMENRKKSFHQDKARKAIYSGTATFCWRFEIRVVLSS